MAVVKLTFELEEDQFTPVLVGIEERMAELAVLYGDLYTAFRRIEERRFNREGPGWAQLASPTVAQRERLGVGSDHPILNRSGATYQGRRGGQLRRSLTTKGAKGAVIEPMPDGVFFGTKDPVAKYHQHGTAKMPARPLVDMTEADADIFADIISDWMYGPAATTGWRGSSFEAVAGAI